MSWRRRIPIALAVVALAGILAWFVLGRGEDGEGRLESSGTVEATEADLAFRHPGRIARIGPREGERVEVGEEVAALDASEMEARLAAAEARVAAAEARLREMERGARPEELAEIRAAVRSAEQRAQEAGREAERTSRLHEGGAVSRETLERAVTAREVAGAALDQARERLALVTQGPRAERVDAQRAAVRQAEAGVAEARAALEGARIVAPFAGLVTVRHREPGETVPAGAPVLSVRDPGDRWVRIYVREDAIGRVGLGQAATIRSDSHADRTFPGEVTFIGSEAEFTPRNVQTAEERTRLVYPVKVRITGDPEGLLKPGVPADVELAVEAISGG